jgi:anti-sigma B factor antagonist
MDTASNTHSGTTFALTEAPLTGTGIVIEVRGELDVATAPALRERLTTVIARDPELVVVDLHAVDFLDSVSLAVLLAASKQLKETSRMAIVVAPDSYARLIFEVSGVDQCLAVVGSRDEALAGHSGRVTVR